jgi:hypothetical protein
MAAGAGLAAMGMPAGYAALAVGATSAATNGGDLRKGMLAGISAYGGAGMAESFIGAGAAATMGGNAGTSSVLQTPAGATSPYSLASSSTTPSTAGYSLGEPSSYLNKSLPSLVSTAPAEAAQAAAAATPAAQQAAALQSMDMGQRFDALKAGASGTNAMNYIKANPFTSLGVASAMLTPDENKTPQKAADTDRGPRAGMRYYPGYGTSLPKPNMQGVEQTFNRPYYAAKGGVTRMATGGITSAPRNQQQLFADYLQRVSSSGAAADGAAPPTNKYDWWKNPNNPAPAAPTPVETAEQYAARMSLNARGGGGGKGEKPEPSAWDSMTDTQKTEYYAQHPFESSMANAVGTYLTKGLGFGVLGMGMDAANGPGYVDRKLNILRGTHPPANSPLAGGPIQYNTDTSEIDRVTANDAANAAYQKEQAEAANLERMQADTYPSGNFYDSSLSSRTDVSGYPLRQSELKSLERGMVPAPVPAPAPVTPAPIEGGVVPGVAPLSTNKLVASEKLAASKPIGVTSGVNFTPADARTPYGEGEGDNIKNVIAALTEQQEGIAKDYMQSGQTLGFEHPDTVELKTEYDKYNNEINNLYNRVQYTDPTTNDYKTPFVNYTPAVEKAVAQTNAALTPTAESNAYGLGYVGKNPTTGLAIGDPRENTSTFNNVLPTTNQVFGINEGYQQFRNKYTPAVDFTDENASQLFGLEPSDYEKQVSDLSQYNLGTLAPDALRYSGTGIPDTLKVPDIQNVSEISADPNADTLSQFTNAFAGNTTLPANYIGSPFAQTAAVNNGVVSDAGNGLGVDGVPAPNMGYYSNNQGGRGFGIPGLGNVWRNAEGTPWRTGDGTSLQTGNAAEAQRQQDAIDSQVLAEARQANPDPNPGHDIVGPGGYSNSLTTWGGGGGSEAAAGGLSTPYGFQHMAQGGMSSPYNLGSYSDGGRLLKGPGDGVSDSIPATIGKGRPARLADGEFVVPARIVSEIGNGSTEAGARKLYAMMDRIQAGRKKSVGKGKVAVNSRADKYLPA